MANTRVKITPAAAAHKCLGENSRQRSGGSGGQRLYAEVFIVMQESRSPAYINSYVKWPFRFDKRRLWIVFVWQQRRLACTSIVAPAPLLSQRPRGQRGAG